MTLIATFFIDGKLALLGDLLLTAPDTARPHDIDDLPTLPRLQTSIPDSVPVQVCGLVSKLCLISPQLAVAWTGPLYQATAILSRLAATFKSTLPTEATLSSALSHIRKECPTHEPGLSLLGCVLAADGKFAFEWHLADGILRRISENTALGSGASAFHRLHEAGALELEGNTPGGHLVALSGQLLMTEAAAATTILERFGGGYQFIVEEDGRFRWLNSVTYIFLHVFQRGPRVELRIYDHYVKHGFLGDIAFQASINCSGPLDSPNEGGAVRLHTARSPTGDQTIPAVQAADIKLQSEYYCLLVTYSAPPAELRAVVAGPACALPAIEVMEKGGVQTLSIDPDFLRRVAEWGWNLAIAKRHELAWGGDPIELAFDEGFAAAVHLAISQQTDARAKVLVDAGPHFGVPRVTLSVRGERELVCTITDSDWREHAAIASMPVDYGVPFALFAVVERVGPGSADWVLTLETEGPHTARVSIRGPLGNAERAHISQGTDLYGQNAAQFTLFDVRLYSTALPPAARAALLDGFRAHRALAVDGREAGPAPST
jgi:hypothetical protein